MIVFPDHLVTEGPERQYDPHAHVHGVSDRAGPGRVSQYRRVRCCLPLLSTTSASRSKFLPRLYTRPARTPVNASQLSSRKATHDSGPLWVAGPLTCDSFIHNTSPVYPGARREDCSSSFWCAAARLRLACGRGFRPRASVFASSAPSHPRFGARVLLGSRTTGRRVRRSFGSEPRACGRSCREPTLSCHPSTKGEART